jgi:hypothetical protein
MPALARVLPHRQSRTRATSPARTGFNIPIAAQYLESGLALDQDRPVAALEKVPDAAVAAVEALRVDSVQLTVGAFPDRGRRAASR